MRMIVRSPRMGYYHPQFVHFAIALLVVGVGFRAISLMGRPAFVAPAATTLLLGGTMAAWLAAQSGTAAHGPVERVPGAARRWWSTKSGASGHATCSWV